MWAPFWAHTRISSLQSKIMNSISSNFAPSFQCYFLFWNWFPTSLLLIKIVFFLVVSYAFALMVAFLLPSTFYDIYDLITSTSTLLNNWKLLKLLCPQWGSVQPKLWLSSWYPRRNLALLVGFWNHSHFEINLPLIQKIIKKKSIKEFVYVNYIY